MEQAPVTQLFNRVLLIEDEAGHVFLIKRALQPLVHELIVAGSAAEGVTEARKGAPDLIVTDLNLPDSRGIEHVVGLRNEYPELPIVVLTSSTALRDAVEAMRVGANDFIAKNFDQGFAEVLRLALQRLFTAQSIAAEKRELERQMRALRTAIDTSDQGLAVVSRGGDVEYSNRALLSFIAASGGVPTRVAEWFGERVAKSSTTSEAVLSALRDAAAGSLWRTEVQFVDDPCHVLDLSVAGVARDCGNAATDAVMWLRDVTEQKRREKFQREILSTTTHDLKGPLGAILVSCELLPEILSDQTKSRELVTRVASSAQTALNLIDEFLSARRIREGSFILRPTLQPVAPVIEAALQDFRAIARARSITLEFHDLCQPSLEAVLDKLACQRVFANLLSNAVKFTPKGGRVSVSLQLRGVDEFQVAVSDTGPGMEPSETQKLFQRFSRLERHQAIEGSGLGLFLVRAVVAAHGGRVEVSSRIGEGSTFTAILPINPPINERGELVVLDFI